MGPCLKGENEKRGSEEPRSRTPDLRSVQAQADTQIQCSRRILIRQEEIYLDFTQFSRGPIIGLAL